VKGETFEHGGKTYTVQRNIKYGEVTQIQSKMRHVLDLGKKLSEKSPDQFSEAELLEIGQKVFANTDDQNSLMANTLSSILGLSQDALNALDYHDALAVFHKMFTVCTAVKKKSEEPSASPSSSTTPSSQS